MAGAKASAEEKGQNDAGPIIQVGAGVGRKKSC